MALILGINLAVRFLLELAILAAMGFWGFKSGGGLMPRTLLGLGTPLLAAVVWGTFLSPKASVPLPAPAALVL